jgi:hypothetical protein
MDSKLLQILENIKDGNLLKQKNEERLKQIESEKEYIKQEQSKIDFVLKKYENGLLNLYFLELQEEFTEDDTHPFLEESEKLKEKLKYIESLILKEKLEQELSNKNNNINKFKL